MGREVMGKGKGKGGGGRGGDWGDMVEGAKVGWLKLFYDTWSQLIISVSCILGRRVGEGGGGEEVTMGRQGMARGTQGRGKGWLVDVVL